jgi:hypothetical protein
VAKVSAVAAAPTAVDIPSATGVSNISGALTARYGVSAAVE